MCTARSSNVKRRQAHSAHGEGGAAGPTVRRSCVSSAASTAEIGRARNVGTPVHDAAQVPGGFPCLRTGPHPCAPDGTVATTGGGRAFQPWQAFSKMGAAGDFRCAAALRARRPVIESRSTIPGRNVPEMIRRPRARRLGRRQGAGRGAPHSPGTKAAGLEFAAPRRRRKPTGQGLDRHVGGAYNGPDGRSSRCALCGPGRASAEQLRESDALFSFRAKRAGIRVCLGRSVQE